jgi:rhamnosyltransferase
MEASIIIPTYNGGKLLHKVLKAIYAQKTTIAYEVVIIDSGSRPDTLEIIKKFPVKLLEITNSSFNHGLTRDQAAAAATGKVLIFINQDAEPGDENWLDQMVKPFDEDESLLAVQGGIRERNDMQRFFWDSCGETFYFTSESKKWIARYHNMGFSTVNAAIRRSAWQQHPFGDMEIFADKGFQPRCIIRDEIVYGDGWVYHTHDYTYQQLRKRCQDEGYGWRLVGENYRLIDCIRDTFIIKNYIRLTQGICNRQVTKWSEIVFPFMRPYWVFRGNHFNRGLL